MNWILAMTRKVTNKQTQNSYTHTGPFSVIILTHPIPAEKLYTNIEIMPINQMQITVYLQVKIIV